MIELESDSHLVLFIGYALRTTALALLDAEMIRIAVSRDCEFDKTAKWYLIIETSGSTGTTGSSTHHFEVSLEGGISVLEDEDELTPRPFDLG